MFRHLTIARRLYSLLKQFYHTESELMVRRKMKLKKNNVYIVRCRQNVRGKSWKPRVHLPVKAMISAIISRLIMNEQKERSRARYAAPLPPRNLFQLSGAQ